MSAPPPRHAEDLKDQRSGRCHLAEGPPAHLFPELRRGGREGAYPPRIWIPPSKRRAALRPGRHGGGRRVERPGSSPAWEGGLWAVTHRPTRLRLPESDAGAMGTSVLLPRRELPREGGRGSQGVPFPLPSRGGGGAQRTASPIPGVGGEPEESGAPRGGAPGERCGASPSQSRPPPPARPSGRLCRREPQQRRLPCAVGVSASLGEWGPLWPGLGDAGKGHPGGRGPRPGLPEPAAPAPPGNTASAGAGSGGSPGETRGALQGPDGRAASPEESCLGLLRAPPPGGAACEHSED